MDVASTLWRWSQQAVAAPDLPALYHLTLDWLTDATGADEGFIATADGDAGELKVEVKTGAPFRDREGLMNLNGRMVQSILGATGAFFYQPEEESSRFFFNRSTSMMACRFALARERRGVVVLESGRRVHFSPDLGRLLEQCAGMLGKLVEMRQAAITSGKENALLWNVKRGLTDPLSDALVNLDESEMSKLLGNILEIALARTHAPCGVILMVDEKTGDLVFEQQAIQGELIVSAAPKRLIRKKDGPSGIAFQVLDSNKPYLANDIGRDPNYIPFFRDVMSTLAAPISFQNRCIGVIVVESPRRNGFTQEDLDVLQSLARSVSIMVRRAQLYQKTQSEEGGAGIMIKGLSPEWEEVERRIEKASATNATVIIRGESGTGKELVARSIHFNSLRAREPLVVVNCAAIPSELLESELFGHVKGAFTGASYDKLGEFEKAHHGTIFLDEIGDLSLPLQVKLLRVLQTGDVQKLGANTPPRKVDVRVLAATNRNLEEMMKAGQFREDLYYRLMVVPIFLPPLRAYRQSVPAMVRAFIDDAARRYNKPVTGLTPEALEWLMNYDFPGNVRELRNLIERAVILSERELLDASDVMPAQAGEPALTEPVQGGYHARRTAVLSRFEENYLRELMTRTGGNISQAAAIAGVHRVNLHQLLKKRGVNPSQFRHRTGPT
ncbi:MAG: Anaerobic nitric oxide reductase transcription regulator NorR [Myxococcota bacterium]|nr:Anaerobic nitric oxide reductase transcription regulator NorR [Myxococcota bacterium]